VQDDKSESDIERRQPVRAILEGRLGGRESTKKLMHLMMN